MKNASVLGGSKSYFVNHGSSVSAIFHFSALTRWCVCVCVFSRQATSCSKSTVNSVWWTRYHSWTSMRRWVTSCSRSPRQPLSDLQLAGSSAGWWRYGILHVDAVFIWWVCDQLYKFVRVLFRSAIAPSGRMSRSYFVIPAGRFEYAWSDAIPTYREWVNPWQLKLSCAICYWMRLTLRMNRRSTLFKEIESWTE